MQISYLCMKNSNGSKKLWPETSSGNNNNTGILWTQAQYEMTEKTNNGDPIV